MPAGCPPAGAHCSLGHAAAPKAARPARASEHRQRRGEGGRQTGPAHQPAQAVLARAGHHERRSPPVLRGGLAGAPAPHQGARDGDEAIPARRARRVLLHEANAVAAARVAEDLPDRARLGQHHRFPDDSGCRRAAVGRQSRMHRPQPVVRAMRRRRSARLFSFRSRSGAGSAVRAGPRGVAAPPRRRSTC